MFNKDSGDIPFGVGVLVAKDGKFLCGIRKDTSEVCGAGGHLQDGESCEQAAAREMQEEFGITPKNLVQIGAFKGDEKYYPSMQFVCTEFEGEPKCDDDEMCFPFWGDIEGLLDDDIVIYKPMLDAYNMLMNRLAQKNENPVEPDEDVDNEDGGQGSGNWGHAGRVGIVGGSMGKGYNAANPKASGRTTEKGTGIASMRNTKGELMHSGAKEFRLAKPDIEHGGTYSKTYGEKRKYTGAVWAYRAEAAGKAAEEAGKKGVDVDKDISWKLNEAKSTFSKPAKKEGAKEEPKKEEAKTEETKPATETKAETPAVEKPVAKAKKEAAETTKKLEGDTTKADYRPKEVQDAIAKTDADHAAGKTPATLKHIDEKVSEAQKSYDDMVKSATPTIRKKYQAAEEEYVANMKKAFAEQDFVIDVKAKYIDSILDSGFYKSQIELGKGVSGGMDDPSARKKFSMRRFGTENGTSKSEYEVYGHLGRYMTHYGKSWDGDMNGEMQIVLKKENVMNRTTYTMDDSLSEYAQPTPVTKPSVISYKMGWSSYDASSESRINNNVSGITESAKNAAKNGHGEYKYDYVELQYHGKITTSDIQTIRISKNLKETARGKAAVKRAEKLGIPVEFVTFSD